MPPDDLLTITEAAEILRRSPATIRRWVRLGVVPSISVGPATYVRRADAELQRGRDDVAAGAFTGRHLTGEQVELVCGALRTALATLEGKRRHGRAS
jgi:excisionase family DNA binding protein